MRENFTPLKNENPFNQSYQEFQKSALYQRLSKKYEFRPYFERFSGIRKLAFFSSYSFNVLSALSASSAVYFFLDTYINNSILSVAITIVFMGLLELFKRNTASRFLENAFQFNKYPIGLCAVVFGLMTLSILFSYNGSKQFIFKLADPPVQVNEDSYTEEYKKEIAAIDAQIAAARETTYKGITTRTSQRTIDKLTEQRKQLQDRIFALEDEIRGKNLEAFEAHVADTQVQAYYFALFTLGCEFLFILCLGYLEYYDFRSYGEFQLQEKENLETQTEQENANLRILIREEIASMIQASKKKKVKPTESEPKQQLEPEQQPNAAKTHTNGIMHDKEIPSKTVINKDNVKGDGQEKQDILAAIKKARSKLNSAEYRLKKNIGKKETSEQNRKEAEQEIQQLEQRLKQLNGVQLKM